VEGTDGRVTITASAHEAASGRVEGQRVTVEGAEPDAVFRLVNDLAVQLLSAFDVQQAPPRLESISTSSVLALNEYLKGEAALRSGDHEEAAQAFGRAVEADSLFALAWFRQSYAWIFTGSPGKAEQPLRKALALRHRLSERDRRLAEAFGALVDIDPERADRLYRAFVYEYPDDVEGWFGRADVMLHFGPLYGLVMDSLSHAFQRVLFLDPFHSEARAHLPWAAGLDGRVALVDSATTRALRVDSSDYFAPVFRLLRTFARGEPLSSAQLAQARAMDDLQRLLTVNMSATLGDPARTQRMALELFTEPSRLPEVQAFGHVMAAHLELGRGRLRPALLELAAADTLDFATGLEGRALLLLHPLLDPPDSMVRRVHLALERWNAPATAPSVSANPWLVPHDSLHPQIRAYLLGALSSRLNNGAAVRRHAAELLRFDTTTTQGVIGRALGHQLLAGEAARTGRNAEALAHLNQSGLRGPQARVWERAYSSPILSQSHGRYLRGDLLDVLGKEAEALRWLKSLWMANAFDLAFLAPAHLEQARIHERSGRRKQALYHYRAFADLWRHAEPELRPRVDSVARIISDLAR
jgi:tetratricopeptide (TPR) repeat protein